MSATVPDKPKKSKKRDSSTKDEKKPRSKSKEKENGTSSTSKHRSSSNSKHKSKDKKKDEQKEELKKDKGRKHEVQLTVPAPAVDNFNYEDDFEEYDDDFEPDSEPDDKQKVETVSKSKNVKQSAASKTDDNEESKPIHGSVLLRRMENRRVSGGGGQMSKEMVTVPKVQSPRVSSANRKIDFNNARERGYENKPSWLTTFHNIVKFETVVHQVAEVSPMASYEYYIQLFGKGNQVQAASQTNDDNVNDETQTELPEKDAVWTQFPPSDDHGLGWGRAVDGASSLEDKDEDVHAKEQTTTRIRDSRYLLFVDIAGKLIADIVSSKTTIENNMYLANKSKFAFSSGYESFSIEHLRAECRVSAVTLRSIQGFDSVLAAYYVKSTETQFLKNKSFVMEYRMEPDAVPYIALYADNEITAISYGPEDSSIVCAGLLDGSCVAYDISESSRLHRKYRLPWPGVKDGISLRVPSYDNAYNACEKQRDDLGSPIVWIVTIGEAASFTFQLVAMNQSGLITLYSLTEAAAPFSEQLGTGDYGMRPSSKIKLTRTNVIPNAVPAIRSNILAANCMVVNPRNVYQVLIATNDGSIINYTRVKQAFAGPRVYADVSAPGIEAFSLRFSPFDTRIFAAGLSNGNISVFSLSQSEPILTLVPPNNSRLSVNFVEWSPTTSHILYSVHGGKKLLVWDIATGKSPLHMCDIHAEYGSTISSTIVWRNENNVGMMAMGLASGILMVHALERLVQSKNDDLLEIIEQKNI